MLPKNTVTERLGLAYRLIQAPMASATTPVLAAEVSEAGGIVGGPTAAAAFMLGAGTVQDCTTFQRNANSKISDPHRCALANAGDESTRVTRLHSGKPARAIRNRLPDELANAEDQIDPYPSQRSLVAPLVSKGESAYLALWAGQNVGLTREMPAAGLVCTLVAETATCPKPFS